MIVLDNYKDGWMDPPCWKTAILTLLSSQDGPSSKEMDGSSWLERMVWKTTASPPRKSCLNKTTMFENWGKDQENHVSIPDETKIPFPIQGWSIPESTPVSLYWPHGPQLFAMGGLSCGLIQTLSTGCSLQDRGGHNGKHVALGQSDLWLDKVPKSLIMCLK